MNREAVISSILSFRYVYEVKINAITKFIRIDLSSDHII